MAEQKPGTPFQPNPKEPSPLAPIREQEEFEKSHNRKIDTVRDTDTYKPPPDPKEDE